MFMSTKKIMENYRNIEESLRKQEELKKAKILSEDAKIVSQRKAIQETLELKEAGRKKFSAFSSEVKSKLLTEAIYKLYDKSLGIHEDSTMNNAIKVNLINSFIEENGTDALLSNFKYKSVLLSEMSRIVSKYHKLIIESVDKKDPTTYVIDKETKENFFDELDMNDFNNVSNAIRSRVIDAANELVQKNLEDRDELKDIMQKAQNKIENAKTDDLKEAASFKAKANMKKVRESRIVNIYESMFRSLTKAVIKRDDMKAQYTENGKLNMDRILESTNIMYTFLEMLNTAKMINIDEEYIENILKSIDE